MEKIRRFVTFLNFLKSGFTFFSEMANTLAKGDRIDISGLWTFYVEEYEGYVGRNPKTGENVQVPAKKLSYFKCGKELKERVDYRGLMDMMVSIGQA